MKITGIEIGEYRQFKNIKFDFTYPENYPDPAKRGKPLDKVCFIGQSGTGKTTLLKFLRVFIAFLSNNNSIELSDDFVGILKSINFIVKKEEKEYNFNGEDVKLNIKKVEQKTLLSLDYEFDYFSEQDLPKTLGIYIADSAASESRSFLSKRPNKNTSAFIETKDEINNEKDIYKQKVQEVGQVKLYDIGEYNTPMLWDFILQDIENYDEEVHKMAVNLINKPGIYQNPNYIVSEFVHWQERNKNPRIDLAQRCLNPIIKYFFLEMDIEGIDAPIVIKTKSGTKIDGVILSAGIRQILATAIPIYKLNTTDSIILFDEPERSLFPDIQRELIAHYTSLAPTAQFFFATHSPIIASAFEPCERFILYFDENGEVRFRNGVAPEGDDPNDILSEDFGLSELMLPKGIEAYDRYRKLGVEIRNEKDPRRKEELIVERAQLGDLYKF